MKNFKRDEYIYLIEQSYFENVTLEKIDQILDCFTDDCLITIRHGDNPLRIFIKNPSSDEMHLRDFYDHLCGYFDAWFGNFTHYIDADNDKCACTFTVELTPKKDSDYLGADVQTLNNCNFLLIWMARLRK